MHQQIKGCPFRNMEASSSTAAAHGDATFAPGARVIYKDGSSGVVQKAHHDDPEGGVYYTVDLGPGRVINALHKSLRPQEPDARATTPGLSTPLVKRLGEDNEDANTPKNDADAALDARFAKREAKVRASFLEATGSLRDYEHAGPDEAPDRTERQRIRARKRRLKRNRRRAGIAAAEALARAPLPAAEAPAPAYAEAPAPAYITTTPPASPERPPKDPAFTPTRERWYKRRVAGVPQSPDTPPAKPRSGRSLWNLLSRSTRKKKVSD